MEREQERDRLIEKAEDVIAAAKDNFPSGPYKVIAVTAIEALVDAGWRPPPTRDVIEQAEALINKRKSGWGSALTGYMVKKIVSWLADAGLLREPPEVS